MILEPRVALGCACERVRSPRRDPAALDAARPEQRCDLRHDLSRRHQAAAMGVVPSVGLPLREWEFSTQVLTVAQLVDGVTLVKLLQKAGTDGWELTDVIDGGEKRVLLMRRPKRSARESRRVGFAPPSHN